MSYAVVVIESSLSSAAFKRPAESRTLASLSGVIQTVLWLYIALRLADITFRGRLGLVFARDRYGLLFMIEMALFLAPAIMLFAGSRIRDIGFLFRVAILIIVAGALYRFSTFLIAFDPGGGYKYFPAVTEMLITVGLVSAEIMAYIFIVKRYPILAGTQGHSTLRRD
jgi:Ni/Fe-hydrogenase subunit HybB-like protein